MPTNDFLQFASAGGANVEDQATYSADSQRTSGNQPGVASSALNNKALRQANAIASAIAQFLVNETGDDVLDNATQSALLATMAKIWPSPTGSILAFGGTIAPTGFQMCIGTSLLRADFPALFAVIGTAFGAADGTHFNVPDFRGQFLRCRDGAAGKDPNSGSRTAMNTGGAVGDNVGSIQSDATQKNGLVLTDPTHSHLSVYYSATGGFGNIQGYASAGSPNGNAGVTNSGVSTGAAKVAADSTTGITLSDGDAETRPTNAYVNYIIKT